MKKPVTLTVPERRHNSSTALDFPIASASTPPLVGPSNTKREKSTPLRNGGHVAKAKPNNGKNGTKTGMRMTAYRLFQKATMTELSARGLRAGEACKALSVEWKALPAAEKAKLEAQADEINRRAESAEA